MICTGDPESRAVIDAVRTINDSAPVRVVVRRPECLSEIAASCPTDLIYLPALTGMLLADACLPDDF